MQVRALLPYFRPPKEPFGTDRSEVRPIHLDEIRDIGDTVLSTALYMYEIMELFGKPGRLGAFETALRTVVLTSVPEIPEESLTALADLVSQNWLYIQQRSRALADPPLGAVRPLPSVYTFTTTRQAAYKEGLALLEASRPFRIAMLRWAAGLTRTDPLDSVLDYCSALEALFRLRDELRLRLSLSVYHVLKRGKREAFHAVYEMYGIRNKFIHGGAVPDVSFESAEEYGTTVAAVLGNIVSRGALPDAGELDRRTQDLFGVHLRSPSE